MCTTIFAHRAHPLILLLLAFNRDEYFDRETEPAHFWPDRPGILAGRDGKAGGTWFGVTDTGRLAVLTNFREPLENLTEDAATRGELTTGFLEGREAPAAYLRSLVPRAPARYNGFNLLTGDLTSGELAFYSNRAGMDAPELLEPGVHGFSNGKRKPAWPKVAYGTAGLESVLQAWDGQGELPWDRLWELMSNATQVQNVAALPDTGVGAALERTFSALSVHPFDHYGGRKYGTRSQTLLVVRADGSAELRERHYEPGAAPTPGPSWPTVSTKFAVPV